MASSVNWIPPVWGLGVLTDNGPDGEAVPVGTVVRPLGQDAEFNDVAPQMFSLFIVPDDDFDDCQDLAPFDAEQFVDRLVDDDAPMWGSSGEVRTTGVEEMLGANTHPAGATGATGAARGKAAGEKTAGGKIAEGKTAEGKTAGGKASGGKASGGKTTLAQGAEFNDVAPQVFSPLVVPDYLEEFVGRLVDDDAPVWGSSGKFRTTGVREAPGANAYPAGSTRAARAAAGKATPGQDAEFNNVAPQVLSPLVVPDDDLDERQDPQPANAEEFVDHLVDDDAPVWGWSGKFRTAGVREALGANTHPAGGKATLARDAEFNGVSPHALSPLFVPDDLDVRQDPQPVDAEGFLDRLVDDNAPVWGLSGKFRTTGIQEALGANTHPVGGNAAGGKATRAQDTGFNDVAPQVFSPLAVPDDDLDERQDSQPFDVEEFVDRIVEDDAPVWDATGEGRTTGIREALGANTHPAGATGDAGGKATVLFPHAVFAWEPSSYNQEECHAGGCNQPDHDLPSLIPYDPLLEDTSLTSSSAEIVPTVTTGLADGSIAVCLGNARELGAGSELQSGVPEEGFMERVTLNMTSMVPSGTLARAGVQDEGVLHLTGAEGFSNEYDDQQFAFLRQQEVDSYAGPGYLSGIVRLGLVTPTNRALLVDWVTGLHAAAPATCGNSPPLSLDTLFLAVNIIDRFLSTREGAKAAVAGDSAMKLAAAAALSLASKHEDSRPRSLWGLAMAMNMGLIGSERDGYCRVCAGVGGNGRGCDKESGGNPSCSCVDAGAVRKAKRELAATEMQIFSALKFRLTVPTALSFLGVYLRRAEGLGYLRSRVATERVRAEAQRILQCLLRHAWSIEHPASAVAAAALYQAFCITSPGEATPTPFVFFAVTGYEVEELRPCMRGMEEVQTGGGMHHLTGIKRRRELDSPEPVPRSFSGPGGIRAPGHRGVLSFFQPIDRLGAGPA